MPEVAIPDRTLVELLIGLDECTLTDTEEIRLFQLLVDTGLAWKLQGRIGRQAMDMLEAGLIAPRTRP